MPRRLDVQDQRRVARGREGGAEEEGEHARRAQPRRPQHGGHDTRAQAARQGLGDLRESLGSEFAGQRGRQQAGRKPGQEPHEPAGKRPASGRDGRWPGSRALSMARGLKSTWVSAAEDEDEARHHPTPQRSSELHPIDPWCADRSGGANKRSRLKSMCSTS
eukprot:7167788-Prymnesium_polylepis.1